MGAFVPFPQRSQLFVPQGSIPFGYPALLKGPALPASLLLRDSLRGPDDREETVARAAKQPVDFVFIAPRRPSMGHLLPAGKDTSGRRRIVGALCLWPDPGSQHARSPGAAAIRRTFGTKQGTLTGTPFQRALEEEYDKKAMLSGTGQGAEGDLTDSSRKRSLPPLAGGQRRGERDIGRKNRRRRFRCRSRA